MARNAGSADSTLSCIVTRRSPGPAGAVGAGAATVTQMPPAFSVSAVGDPPRWIVLMTSPECGSTRITVPSRVLATQTAASVATTAEGPSPTGVVCATVLVSGSMRTRTLLASFVTHTPAGLTATAVGRWPTGIVVASRSPASIRVTVPSELLVTHTEPAPAATADGRFPTSTDAVMRPELGSIRAT